MSAALDCTLDRLQAAGRITPGDAEQVRAAAAFLADLPPAHERDTPAGRRQRAEAIARHFPNPQETSS